MSGPTGHPESDALRVSLAEADRLFADTPTLDAVSGCGMCWSDEELRLLGGDPTLVSEELLGRFALEVPSHWDAEEAPVTWQRLMPRLLRRLAGTPPDAGAMFDFELSHFAGGARFRSWPVERQAVVERCFGAILRVRLLDRFPDANDLFEGIAHATGDVRRLLDFLDAWTGPEADGAVLFLAMRYAEDLVWEDDGQVFFWWYDVDRTVLPAWFASPSVETRLDGYRQDCRNAVLLRECVRLIRAGERPSWFYQGYQAEGPFPVRVLPPTG
ncbi:hypothetical protein Lfu02_47930 [Longispora fulva]|nr:hypothetical protein Lfu02_47930 [Longispora fulva]